MEFSGAVNAVSELLSAKLIGKNNAYGNSALEPVRTFSTLDARSGILVRMDDKLTRLTRGNGSGDEDAAHDLLGYTILYIASCLIVDGSDSSGPRWITDAIHRARAYAHGIKPSNAHDVVAFSREITDVMWLGKAIDDHIRNISHVPPMTVSAAIALAGELMAWHALKLMQSPNPEMESCDRSQYAWESAAEIAIQYLGSDEELTPKGLMDSVIEASDELDRWRNLGRDFVKSLGIEPLDELTPEYVFVLASNSRDRLTELSKQHYNLLRATSENNKPADAKVLDAAFAKAEQERSRKAVDAASMLARVDKMIDELDRTLANQKAHVPAKPEES